MFSSGGFRIEFGALGWRSESAALESTEATKGGVASVRLSGASALSATCE